MSGLFNMIDEVEARSGGNNAGAPVSQPRVAPDVIDARAGADYLRHYTNEAPSAELADIRTNADYLRGGIPGAAGTPGGAQGGLPRGEYYPVQSPAELHNGRSDFANEVSGAVRSLKSNMLDLGAAVTGDRSMAADASLAARDAAFYMNQSSAPGSFEEVNGVGDALAYGRKLAVGSAAQMIPLVLATGATLAVPEAAVPMWLARGARIAAMYGTAAGDIAGNQGARSEELTGERQYDTGAIAAGAVPYTALELLNPVEGGLMALGRGLPGSSAKNIAGRVAATAGMGAAVGGPVETAQEMVNQKFGTMAVDPNAGMFDEDAVRRYQESFVGGALLEGAMTAPGGIRARAPSAPNTDPIPTNGAPHDLLSPTVPADAIPSTNYETPAFERNGLRPTFDENGQGDLFSQIPSVSTDPTYRGQGEGIFVGPQPIDPATAPAQNPYGDTSRNGDLFTQGQSDLFDSADPNVTGYGTQVGPQPAPAQAEVPQNPYGDTSTNDQLNFTPFQYSATPQQVAENQALPVQQAQGGVIASASPQPQVNPQAGPTLAQQRYDAAEKAWRDGTATESDIRILDMGRPGGTAKPAQQTIDTSAQGFDKGFKLTPMNRTEGPMADAAQRSPEPFALEGQTGAPNPAQGELNLGEPTGQADVADQGVSDKQLKMFDSTGKPTQRAAKASQKVTPDTADVVAQRAIDHGFTSSRALSIMSKAVDAKLDDDVLFDIGELLGQSKYGAAEKLLSPKKTEPAPAAPVAKKAQPAKKVDDMADLEAAQLAAGKPVNPLVSVLRERAKDGLIDKVDAEFIESAIDSGASTSDAERMFNDAVARKAKQSSKSDKKAADYTPEQAASVMEKVETVVQKLDAAIKKAAAARSGESIKVYRGIKDDLRAAVDTAMTDGSWGAVEELLRNNNATVENSVLKNKRTGEAKGMTAAEVRSLPLVRSFHGKVKVVETWQDLPEGHADGPETVGTYDAATGQVWVVAAGHSSPMDVARTVLHELVGHKGVLERLTSVQKRQLHADLRQIVKTDPKVAAIWEEVQQTYRDSSEFHQMMELVARVAETNQHNSFVNRFLNYVRQILRDIGLPVSWVQKQNIQDIYALLRDSEEYLRTPPDGNGGGSDTRAVFERREPLKMTDTQAVLGKLNDVASAVRTDSIGSAHRFVLNKVKSMRYMISQYGNQLPSLQEYDRLARAMESTGHKIRKEHEGAVTSLLDLKPDQLSALSELIWEGDQRMWRLDEQPETAGWADERKAEYAAAKAKFDALPQETRTAYTQALNTPKVLRERASKLLREMHDAVGAKAVADRSAARDAAQARLDKLMADKADQTVIDAAKLRLRAAKAALTRAENDHKHATKQLDNLFQQSLVGYFPHRRFGDWVVVYKSDAMKAAETDLQEAYDALNGVETDDELTAAQKALADAESHLDEMKQDAQHFYVEAFDKQSDAAAKAKELGGRSFLAEQFYTHADSVSRKFISDMQDAATLQFGEGVGAEVANMLNQQYLKNLSNKSIFKSSLKRANVEGFSRDLVRVLADDITRYAGQLPKMQYGADLRDAITKIQEEGRAEGTTQTASVIAEQVKQNYEQDQKVKSGRIEGAIAKYVHAWYLAMSPAYLTLQTFQGPMISAPAIAGKFGVGDTVREMGAAAKEMLGKMSTQIKDETKAHGIKSILHVDFDFKGMKKEEAELIEHLRENNVLSITQDVELTELAKGRGEGGRLDTVLKAAVMPGHLVEVWNRSYTGLAAYRLAVKNGMEHQAAMAYATDIVAQTHGDYSMHNKPYALKPGLFPGQRIVMLFRSYQHMMAELIIRNFRESQFGKDAPDTLSEAEKREWYANRSVARRTLAGIMITHATMAGTLGVPGLATVGTMMAALGIGDDEEKWETSYRRWLADMTNPVIGEVLAKGITRAPGLDKVFGDISSRVGIQDVFNPIRIMGPEKEGRDRAAQVAAAMFGPAAGIVGNWMEANKAYAHGQFDKVLPNLLPKAVADVLKAGNMVMDDQRSATDVANQLLGFRPASVAREQEATSAKLDAKAAQATKRDYFNTRWATLSQKGDAEGLSRLTEELATYKARNPGFKLTVSDMRKAQVRKARPVKPNANVDYHADFAVEDDEE